MIVLDTSGLLAALDVDAKQHRAARAAVEAAQTAQTPLLLSPLVLAELDYLVSTRLGSQAMAPVLDDIAGGACELVPFGPEDVAGAREVMERYADLAVGVTDASLVVIAARYRTSVILTLDERHFRVVRPLGGSAFTLLPADRPGAVGARG